MVATPNLLTSCNLFACNYLKEHPLTKSGFKAVWDNLNSEMKKALWDSVKDQYIVVSIPHIYKDFKEAISICFNTNQHPAPQFEKMAATFAHVGAVTVGTGANATTLAICPQLQALIAMSALPQKWEHLIPVMCNNLALADLQLAMHKAAYTEAFCH
ncbi:hypothetical protein EDB87DRAFT_1687141 [Lactarius vividus]|nr:hypothetical protein EDB87DRAFT_1687141 [Lactarius vividus]